MVEREGIAGRLAPVTSLAQHTTSLLAFLDGLKDSKVFTDLRIVCEDGVVESYRVLLAACSELIAGCLVGSGDYEEETATLLLPGVTVAEVKAFHASLFSYGDTPSHDYLDSVLKVLGTIGVNIGPFIDIDLSKSDSTQGEIATVLGEEEITMTLPTIGRVDLPTDSVKTEKVECDSLEVCETGANTEKKLEYCCLFCEKRYKSIASYEKHLAQHRDKGKESQIVRVEDEESTTTFTLDVNENDEIVSSPHLKCDRCSLEFILEADYEKHRKTECTKTHICTMCNKTFSSTQTLSNHIKLHTKELDFSCEICQKQFVSRSVLGNHMKTHDPAFKIPRFNCMHCSKVLTHPSNLKRHIRTAHFELSDKKTYDCNDCDKSFRDPSALKHHSKTHMQVRPFPCSACTKSFGSKTQLDNHLRIHTGEKPFLCNMCGRCFVTKGQLKSHKMNRHVGVKYQKCHLCPDCGQSFVKEFDLRGEPANFIQIMHTCVTLVIC